MFNSFRSFNQLINHRNYLYIIIKILCIYNSISDYYSVDDVVILYSKPDTPIHADRYFIRKMPTVVQYVDYRGCAIDDIHDDTSTTTCSTFLLF